MDPNEAHKELTRLAAEVMNGGTLDVPEQMEFGAHFQALDDWIKSGGFLPTAWSHETDWPAFARALREGRTPDRPDLAGNWFDHTEQGGA